MYTVTMPFNYAHARFALDAMDAALPDSCAVIAACPSAFCAGAMGPDPYFADELPKPLWKPCRALLAGRMHALDARALFSAFFTSAETDAQRAYTLGMLCHFLLDTHAHAYIDARFPGKQHTPAEMHIDLPFCDLRPHPALTLRPSVFFRLSGGTLDALDALHARAVRRLWNEESGGVFARCYKKWVYLVARLTFDPKGRKRRFFHRVVTRDPADSARDLMNLRHACWRAPWAADTERRESFPDLYDAALAAAPALLEAAAAGYICGSFEEALDQIGGRCMDGSPLF